MTTVADRAASRPAEPAGTVEQRVTDALRRSDPSGEGIRRRRCGRGFRYLGPGGQPVTDPEVLARIKALVLPPAWEDVWICTDPTARPRASGPSPGW